MAPRKRVNGTGSVAHLKDGRWVATADIAGRRVYRYRPSRNAAELLLRHSCPEPSRLSGELAPRNCPPAYLVQQRKSNAAGARRDKRVVARTPCCPRWVRRVVQAGDLARPLWVSGGVTAGFSSSPRATAPWARTRPMASTTYQSIML